MSTDQKLPERGAWEIRRCTICQSKLRYRGRSAVNARVELWQCEGRCYPKTFHLNSDGTEAPAPHFQEGREDKNGPGET